MGRDQTRNPFVPLPASGVPQLPGGFPTPSPERPPNLVLLAWLLILLTFASYPGWRLLF
jgi:hypothetical protein